MLRKIDIHVQRYIFTYLMNCDCCNKHDIKLNMNKCGVCNKNYCVDCKSQLTYGTFRDEQIRQFCRKCVKLD